MLDFCVFLKSNNDIDFTFFSVITLVFVKYIINYAIKKEDNQYQRIIKFVFICKTRINVIKSFNNKSNSNDLVRIADIEKLALRP